MTTGLSCEDLHVRVIWGVLFWWMLGIRGYILSRFLEILFFINCQSFLLFVVLWHDELMLDKCFYPSLVVVFTDLFTCNSEYCFSILWLFNNKSKNSIMNYHNKLTRCQHTESKNVCTINPLIISPRGCTTIFLVPSMAPQARIPWGNSFNSINDDKD